MKHVSVGKLASKIPASAYLVGKRAPPIERRYKAGTVTIREIRKLQRSTQLLIRKAPFRRTVRLLMVRLVTELGVDSLRVSEGCYGPLQEALEASLIKRFEDSNLCAIHAKRITVRPCDLQLSRHIKKGQ